MPERIAAALEDLALSEHEVAAGLRELAADLAKSEKRRRRESRIYKAVLGLLVVLVVALSIAVGILLHTAGDNRQTLTAVQRATGPAAQARSATGTTDILRRNAIETDCRERRAAAGLPAPPLDARPCTDQTSTGVYPGGPIPAE